MKRLPDTPHGGIDTILFGFKRGEVWLRNTVRSIMFYESCPEVDGVAYMPEVYKISMVRMTVKGLTNPRM